MAIPKTTKMRQPVLEYLGQSKQPVKTSALIKAMANHFGITKRNLEAKTAGGGKKFDTYIGITVTGLHKLGLVISPRHGYLEITQKGRDSLNVLEALPDKNTAKQHPVRINDEEKGRLIEMTSTIVAAYVTNNPVQPEQLSGIIESAYTTLLGLKERESRAETRLQQPAVPIEKSVSPDYITCLECGRKFKSLKGHINQLHGRMTPDEYRKKWGLLPDYPMVAELYAIERSEMAKRRGLEKNVRRGKKAEGNR